MNHRTGGEGLPGSGSISSKDVEVEVGGKYLVRAKEPGRACSVWLHEKEACHGSQRLWWDVGILLPLKQGAVEGFLRVRMIENQSVFGEWKPV